MEEIHENLMNTNKNFDNKNMKVKFLKVLKWAGWVMLAGFIFLVGVRTVHFMNLKKTNVQIEKIHATKLQMDDVMGVNLPPDPGELADTTIEGIDANNNYIRDDVELAIFKEYPNSAKTRAVLLQYAMALQTQMTYFNSNTDVSTEIATEEGRADICLSNTLVPRKTPESSRSYADIEKIDFFVDFIKNKQFNTKERSNAKDVFYKNVRSFGESDNVLCDIDSIKLPN